MASLVLNVAPFALTEPAVVRATEIPFVSREQLQVLRRQHGTEYVFRRREDRVLCLHLVESPTPLAEGGASTDIALAGQPALVAALLERAIVDLLVRLGRVMLDVEPIQFLSENPKDDLVKAVGADLPDWLKIRLSYRIHVRLRHPREETPEVIVVVDTHVRHDIEKPVSELLTLGIDPRTLYVREDISAPGEAFRRRRLIGCVDQVANGHLVLSDGRDGREKIDAATAYLEARDDATERCLQKLVGARARRLMEAIADAAHQLQGAEQRLARIKGALQFLAKDALVLAPRVRGRIRALVGDGSTFYPRFPPPSVTYVFDPRGVKLADKNSVGLMKHGPYSSHGSAFNSAPRICVICDGAHQGEVERFLYRFLEGIEHSVYARGLRGLYAMQPRQPVFFPATDGSAQAYRKASNAAIEAAAAENAPWDLAFVQVRESTKDLLGDANPYLVTKATFLNQQIPTQEFRLETMRQPDAQLPWSLGNMALATYAKLGGTPWLLKSDPLTTHELVIGLGSAWTAARRLGERQRLVGITTLFAGDGSYWLNTLSRAVPFEEYGEAVLESVTRALNRIRHDRGWQPGDQVRLVFHAFKPFRNVEADAVLTLADKLKTDFDVSTAFVHVVADSPYLLFEPTNRTGKARFVPSRGPLIELGDRRALVLATGAAEMKRPGVGMPRPLLLELHPRSSFTDLRYLSEQAFRFTSHSWQGFLPTAMPVTVGYSQLIAKLLARLRDVSFWSPDVLYGRIGFSRWFL